MKKITILFVILIIVILSSCSNLEVVQEHEESVQVWELGSEYYYDEYSGEYWGGEFDRLDNPMYFGESKTIDDALANSIKALKYYYGDESNIDEHIPIGLNYFIDEEIWLVFTEYEPSAIGGGIGFTINPETGELSDYVLQE